MWKDTFEKNGSAWFICNYQFSCRMPSLASRDPDEIRFYGVRAWGDNDRDQLAADELIDRPLTISQIAGYREKGVTVSITKHRDTEIIYEAVQRHLEMWEAYVKESLTPSRAPLEDLIQLDRLAGEIFPHAACYRQSPVLESILAKAGYKVKINLSEIFKTQPTVFTNVADEPAEDPRDARAPLASTFERQLFKTGRAFLPDVSAFRDMRRGDGFENDIGFRGTSRNLGGE